MSSRFVILVLLAFAVSARAQEPPIVQVYCSELTRLGRGDVPISDEQWSELAGRLESRELRPAQEGVSDAIVEDCLRENAPEFERAEFILNGRELLLKAIRGFQPPRSAAETATPLVAGVELSVPGLERVPVPSQEPATDAAKEWLSETEARASHYTELWKAFLEELRSKLVASLSVPRQVNSAMR